MDFRFDLNNILPSEIVCVNNTLIIPGWKSTTRNRTEYQQLYELINVIGEASAFSQSLNRVITTAEKLQNSDHLLYLMKEFEPQSGRTLLVGMLKIGRKKLFLLDPNKVTKEVAPLCILDFYIHESRQRRGYGRKMFDFMLMHQSIDPGHFAVDKPSDKFLSFLKRHYGLFEQIPQTNNFVVYSSFFKERPVCKEEVMLTQVGRSARSSRAASPDGTLSSSASDHSRRSSGSTQYAGKPSTRLREGGIPSYSTYGQVDAHNLYLDQYYASQILYGNDDWQGPLGRKHNARHQTSLDWMRGPGTQDGYSHYSSRSPSYNASPLAKTPRDASPYQSGTVTPLKPLHPVVEARMGSRNENKDEDRYMQSIGPTPACSPDRQRGISPNGPTNGHANSVTHSTNGTTITSSIVTEKSRGKEENEKHEIQDEVNTIIMNGQINQLSIRDDRDELDAPEIIEGKTGCWRDGLARDSAGLIDHMTKSRGTSSGGTLNDNDSVHGHLKFHHHSLW